MKHFKVTFFLNKKGSIMRVIIPGGFEWKRVYIPWLELMWLKAISFFDWKHISLLNLGGGAEPSSKSCVFIASSSDKDLLSTYFVCDCIRCLFNAKRCRMYFLYSEKSNLMMKKNKKGNYNVVWWVQGEVSFRGSIGAYGWVDNSLDIDAAV